ncbi:flagellar basal body rod protein FlgC, partial [Clostridioides difficile]
MRISASGLTAESLKMDIISSNVANINATRGPNGEAYRRKVVSFEENYDNKLG